MSKESEAKTMYGTLCQTIDNMQWRYGKDEANLVILAAVVGQNLSIQLFIKVDQERQVMFLKSPMPYTIPQDKREVVATAVAAANFAMLNGSFEFDTTNGNLAFKMVVPFMQSIISESVCRYMILLSCKMTDTYNDKFKALVDERMNLDEFVAFVRNEKL